MVQAKKRNNAVLLAMLLIVLISGPEFATDMYIPSLPAISQFFHAFKSTAAMTITGFLLGQAVFQLFYGGFSDNFGRKLTLLLGTIVVFVGTIISLFAPNIITLLVGRVIQGAGAGVGLSMCLAIARDVYEGKMLAKALTIIFTFYFVMFAIAPIVGGYVQHYLGWRWVFIILGIYFIVQFFWVLLFFRETYTKEKAHKKGGAFKKMLHNYWRVMTSRIFMSNMLAASFGFSGLFAYVAITPFLFQKKLHLTSFEYGWLAAFIAVALLIATNLANWLIQKWGLYKPNAVAVLLCFLGSIILLVLGLVGLLNIWVVMVPFACFVLGSGMLSIACSASALSVFGDIAGTAGALWGSLQFFLLFATSFIYAHVHAKTQLPFAWILIGLSCCVLLCILFAFPAKKKGKKAPA